MLSAFLATAFALAFFVKAKADFINKQGTMQQAAERYQNSLEEKLNLASHALDLAALNPDSPALEQISAPYFKAVNYVNTAGQITPLVGETLALPDQSEAVKIHLSRGSSALIAIPGDKSPARIFLVHGVMEDNQSTGVLTAEIIPEFIWNAPDTQRTSLHVLSRQGDMLFSTDTSRLPAIKAVLQKATRALSGEAVLGSGDQAFKAGFVSQPLRDNFAAADWAIFATTPNVPVWMLADTMDWILVAAAALSLILLWWFLVLLRRQNAPTIARKSGAGTQMAVFQPMDMVRAMDEFDRAILSNASFDNVMDLAFKHVPNAIASDMLVVTWLDESGAQNTLLGTGDTSQTLELPKLDATLKTLLETQPDGIRVEYPEEYEYLKPLVALGAAKFQLFPLYRDAELFAILQFGFKNRDWLSIQEHMTARSFADRMAVALTSVMRNTKLYQQQHFDSVTNLPNRTFYRERLSQEISRARRKQLLIAIIYINLAGFKKINDSLGYAGGDSILKQVADKLKSKLRESDLVSRFGSDEFVVMLPDLNNANEIGIVAGKLVDAFSQNYTYEGHASHLNAAMGISIFPNDGQAVDQLLHHAETAMTRIKSSGHTQYVYYEEHMNSKAIERLKLEHDLRLALTEDQLFLVYQPQIDLRTGKIAGVEALVRWNHPSRGLVNPGEFISIAEETGLIIKMSEIIRHIACKQYVEWKDKGVAPPRIAVNVSSQDLRRKTFADEVMETLKQYEVPTSAIELEITESMFVDASGGVVDVLRGLQDEGFLIAIDDFGTGYSSLSYLGLLPFDILKVDRSFVLGIGKPAEKIVSVIVDVAHTFEKKVIAEGVDSQHQHEYLVELGCEIIQGYLFSKPLKAEEFEQYATKMAA